jgi:hypothetical protein
VKTLSRFFLLYGIRKKFDLSIIHYRQIKACYIHASTSRDRINISYSCLVICPLESIIQDIQGASVAKWLAHLPFTSEAADSGLSENFLNATRTQCSCEKSKSQRSAESRGFPPGSPVSSHRES